MYKENQHTLLHYCMTKQRLRHFSYNHGNGASKVNFTGSGTSAFVQKLEEQLINPFPFSGDKIDSKLNFKGRIVFLISRKSVTIILDFC